MHDVAVDAVRYSGAESVFITVGVNTTDEVTNARAGHTLDMF
jgi:hypothetical protein